jgi:D-alanyl-lipoteichoic acid acyltransferase DltB (MBOAT superfamily)
VIFTSYEFILGFLPVTYIGFLLARRYGGWRWAINFLALASIAFYGMWGIVPLLVLIGSIGFNYSIGVRIAAASAEQSRTAKLMLIGGVLANLFALGYLKYLNFFIDIANQFSGAGISYSSQIMLIGMSFFTFIQIGYLIDAYNGSLLKHDFPRYVVFAAFFPCVTAGPLVMQREMMEQTENKSIGLFNLGNLVVGLTMFGIGLAKKVVLADAIAPMANTVFDGVAAGQQVTMLTAWVGSVCYALQLYFDFSGYSDMAIGLGLMFGIKLPLNFDSPFKATNISDFWRRWHMTMTRFFTSYIYSSLAMAGRRRTNSLNLGRFGRYLVVAAIPSFFTFMVAGVWHGSGWTYVIYGVIHGTAIAVYLGWREFSNVRLPYAIAWLLTMVTVICGLVMFRAADVPTALALLKAMWGVSVPAAAADLVGVDIGDALSAIVLLGAMTQLLPNSQQILHRDWPSIDVKPDTTALDAGLLAWRPGLSSALVSAAIMAVALTSIGTGTNFLYYKF